MGRALNEQELARLVAATDDPLIRAQLLVDGMMRLRWGEFAALNVGGCHVDLDEGRVHVRPSFARGRARYELKTPKTATSLSAVPIPEVMGTRLRTITRGRYGPLFLATSGDRLNYHSSRRALIRVAADAAVAD